MEQTCAIIGNADMYGLGIRIGYYLQWLGLLMAPYVAPKEVQTMRLADAFFVSAMFLALLVQVSKNGLDTVEIYITVLFSFGSNLYSLPVLLWRVFMRCDPRWDPSRYPRVPVPGPAYQRLYGMLVIAVFAFQMWFWAAKVPQLAGRTCVQYGFIFTKVRLDSVGLRIANLTICGLLLALLALFWTISMMPNPETVVERFGRNINGEKSSVPDHVYMYHYIDSFVKFLVAITVIVAIEWTIRWNKIAGVSSIDSVGQIVPLFVGILSIARILYKTKREDRPSYRPGTKVESDELPGRDNAVKGRDSRSRPQPSAPHSHGAKCHILSRVEALWARCFGTLRA